MSIPNLSQAEKQNARYLLQRLESLADDIDFFAKILDDKQKEYNKALANLLLARDKYALARYKLKKSGFEFPEKFTFESMQEKINQYKEELAKDEI